MGWTIASSLGQTEIDKVESCDWDDPLVRAAAASGCGQKPLRSADDV
jgi:hypothetical protein